MIRILIIEKEDRKPHHNSPFGAAQHHDVARAHVVLTETDDGNYVLAKSRNTIAGNVFPTVQEALEHAEVIAKRAKV